MAGAGAPTASSAIAGTCVKPVSAAARIGRRGIWRIAPSAPSSAPTPSAALIAPQAAAPPSSCWATTGPSTLHAPQVTFASDAHSHERPHPRGGAEDRPALAELLPQRGRRALDALGHAHPGQQQRAGAEGGRVDRQRPAGADGGDEDAREHGAADLARRHRGRPHAVGLLEPLRPDDRGQQADRRRAEEPGRGAAQGRQQRDAPHLGRAGDDDRGEQALRHAAARRPRRP